MTDINARTNILDAAEGRFAAHGLAGARVASIAEEAGVNKAMLYYYFKSKERLYLAVLERLADEIVALANQHLGGAEGGSVEAFLQGYQEVLFSRPAFAKVIIRDVLNGGTHARQVMAPRLQQVLPLFIAALHKGQELGHVNPNLDLMVTPPALVGPFIFAAIAHPVLQQATGQPLDDLLSRYRANTTELLLHGLVPREAQ